MEILALRFITMTSLFLLILYMVLSVIRFVVWVKGKKHFLVSDRLETITWRINVLLLLNISAAMCSVAAECCFVYILYSSGAKEELMVREVYEIVIRKMVGGSAQGMSVAFATELLSSLVLAKSSKNFGYAGKHNILNISPANLVKTIIFLVIYFGTVIYMCKDSVKEIGLFSPLLCQALSCALLLMASLCLMKRLLSVEKP